MIEVDIMFIISAFIAGVLMFLAPCTLPLVPAYLAFISGLKQKEMTKTFTREDRRQLLHNAVAFIFGFSFIFILFGMLAGLFGTYVGQFRPLLLQVGGVFIIIFGLIMFDIIHINILSRTHRIAFPKILRPGNPVSAFAIGSTFALGWTPCVGPVLASILLLASTQATVLSGGLLLALFSLGLAIPFILTALLYSRAIRFIEHYSWITRLISNIGGAFLIVLGILLLTDNFELMFAYGYVLFELLNLTALFNYF